MWSFSRWIRAQQQRGHVARHRGDLPRDGVHTEVRRGPDLPSGREQGCCRRRFLVGSNPRDGTLFWQAGFGAKAA